MTDFDVVVVGAGVIGIAVARELAMRGNSVLLLEREERIGTGISARNSEVIHAGLHYPHGSLKERLCIAGKHLLYAFCETHGVPHRRIGKLTFAKEAAELAHLEGLWRHASDCGADCNLALLDAAAVSRLEPELDCAAALHSPSTGIVDTRALMLALLGEAEDHRTVLACKAEAVLIKSASQGWRIDASGSRIHCRTLVNAAGLGAQSVARRIEALDQRLVPPLHFARGSYWTYSGRVPFSRLLYPLPTGTWLGAHLTLDLAGAARFGPDFEWIDTEDYDCSTARKDDFLTAARRIWPNIEAERLTPGWSGIRPRIAGPGEPDADFIIQGPADHGLAGLVNLFGIESPGLTSSLALAGHVADLVA